MKLRTKSAALVMAAMVMAAGSSMTAFATQTYMDWYYDRLGEYPTGNITEWERDPVYWSYLQENDVEAYNKLKQNYADAGSTSTSSSSSSSSSSATVTYAYPDDPYWSGNTAKWGVSGKASKYQVRVYRDGSKVDTKNTTSKSISLSSVITKTGYYTFEVRAYNSSSGWSDWVESDDKYFTVSSTSNSSSTSTTKTTTSSGGPGGTVSTGTTTAAAQWLRAADGSNKWWYKHADGSYTKNNWELINSKWYYFDESGWMKTGWLNVGGATYYLGADGAMVTGLNFIDGATHSFDNSGKMVS